MKKFLITVATTAILGLGTSTKAQAQIVYGYTIPTDGGVERSGLSLTGYGPQSYTNFYSPLTGYMSQTSGSMNTLWSRGSYTSIYSPFTGYMTESRGTVNTPFGLASYLNYYSPYTGNVGVSSLANSASANNKNLTNFNNVVPFPAAPGQFWLSNGNNSSHHR
jgi:hypothetical protein